MEELELMNEVYLYAIFMSVIERFGIEYRSVTFFRYKKSSIFDGTLGVVRYDPEQLKNGDADLIFEVPDFSTVPQEDLYKTVEGFFSHENGHLKDELVLRSWIRRKFHFFTKERNADKLAEEFGYKSSLEAFKNFFIYPYLQQLISSKAFQYPPRY